MAPGGGDGPKPAVLSRTTTGIDSLHVNVNPGSPRSLPPVTRGQDETASVQSPQPLSPTSPISDTDETDLKDRDEIALEDEKRLPRFTIDPDGLHTHDKTTVDVVAVPCPGGDSLRSWNRDSLVSRYFGALSMRDAEVKDEATERPSPSWVRQGIRREADRARILLYDHTDDIAEGTTLSSLADALLQDLQALRDAEDQQRPLLFIGHSVGGLVVKMALTKASRDARYENIRQECYGVAFFGTPHQGSSYFAMPSLSSSIQALLQLSVALPTSITDDLRVGNSLLLRVDEDFKAVSNDIQIWTFYETIDSRLSSGTSNSSKGDNNNSNAAKAHTPANIGTGSDVRDVYFTAPLTSIKSAILGMRQERIFPLQSDHANIASFGRHNVHSLRIFLKQLASQIARADESVVESGSSGQWTLGLEQKVNVEVHGFFDDPPAGQQSKEEGSIVRAWSTRLPLKEFLNKGPEECLSDRLNEVEGSPEPGRFLRSRGRTSIMERETPNGGDDGEIPAPDRGHRASIAFPIPNPMTVRDALGIQDHHHTHTGFITSPASPMIRPSDMNRRHAPPHSAPVSTPRGPTTPPSAGMSPRSSPMRQPSPLIRADFDQDLAVDRLSPPLRGRVGRSVSRSFSLGSNGSRFEYRDFPPFSQRSQSAIEEAIASDSEDLEASPRLSSAVVAIRNTAKTEKKPSETVIIDEVPMAFVKPDVKTRKFVWVHVPFNNPTWAKNVLQTLEVAYKKDYSSLYGQDFWATRHTRGRHAQHYAYYAKPGCYYSAPRTMSPRNSLRSPSLSPGTPATQDSRYMCLFLPYLHFDSYKRLVRRRELIIERLERGRARPVPEFVAKSDSLELQVVWEYLGHDPPINCRRTIDQYEYPSLRDTRTRDDDQMLYKLTKERTCSVPEDKSLYLYSQSSSNAGASDSGRSSGGLSWRERIMGKDADQTIKPQVLNGNVLVVDQLWLWVIQSHTVASFFPKRESDPIEGPLYQQADLRDSIFNEVNVDLTRQCENAYDLAALAALHAVSVLLDRSSHPDLEVFRIFEEAISALTEKLTSSLKDFRAKGFRDKAFDYEPVENKARSIRKRHKEEGLRAEQENRDNTSALLELRDIEDELQTLLHLFERQSKIIMSMHSIYARPELRDQTTNGRSFLNEAIKRLREYAQQANEMIERVRATRDDYDKLLQMVQRQAQVDEVRLSRLHADLASAQSRSVMIFTTFTVIFLPLTFFTGLFGMNTQEWGGENNLSLKTIGMISLPASSFLVISSLVIAFSTNARRFCRFLEQRYRHVARWVYYVIWVPVFIKLLDLGSRARRKKNDGEREGGRKKKALEREASDFWERHRLERDRGYKIPEANKKKPGVTGGSSGTFGIRLRGGGSKAKKDKGSQK